MQKLTVITVTYNAASVLEKTIQSVISQTYFPQIAYIIIDGGSQDGTLDIIKKYESYLSFWISEPDQGIYDAMNKGIKVAKGEWINFMNAGDSFATTTIVADVFKENMDWADVVYGNYIVVYQTFKKYKITPKDLTNFYRSMQLNHQSTFIRTKLAQSHLYDLKYKIACDYEQLFYFYTSGKVFHHIDKFIAEFADGGVSTVQKINYLKEHKAIVKKYAPEKIINNHHINLLKANFIAFLRKIFPHIIFEQMMLFKNRFAG
jgi:glycosyltransferase involved in cell wall biosynthesis